MESQSIKNPVPAVTPVRNLKRAVGATSDQAPPKIQVQIGANPFNEEGGSHLINLKIECGAPEDQESGSVRCRYANTVIVRHLHLMFIREVDQEGVLARMSVGFRSSFLSRKMCLWGCGYSSLSVGCLVDVDSPRFSRFEISRKGRLHKSNKCNIVQGWNSRNTRLRGEERVCMIMYSRRTIASTRIVTRTPSNKVHGIITIIPIPFHLGLRQRLKFLHQSWCH